ncbi:MAG: hypothetical protein OXB88_08190, partial [Bacteriovoracales bacterium]|nr:hypothetical protein [Bacteriovoracales bacterium]
VVGFAEQCRGAGDAREWEVQAVDPNDPPVNRTAAGKDELPNIANPITAQTFVMGAAGVIFDNGTTPPSVDVWTIDQQKTIDHTQVGY